MAASARAGSGGGAKLLLAAGAVVGLLLTVRVPAMPQPGTRGGVRIPEEVPLTVPIPGYGDATVRIGSHAVKHEAGTLPASAILAAIRTGTGYELYYSPALSNRLEARYLVVVRLGGLCGGMPFTVPKSGPTLETNAAFALTAFGGSECGAGSCAYWDGVIVRDGYKRIAVV